ncbi:MAG: hypothetical protein H3C58_04950, partial [Fimbriimonadaceae bacterium]|nr:hypothetical protein [Fimbriimonadaceae bacterium]
MTVRTNSLRTALIGAILAAALGVAAQTVVIRHKNSAYTVTYEAAQKRLSVSSDNLNAVWRREVSRRVPTFRSFSAAATAAGPIVIYDDGTNTMFSLIHWKNGGNKVERSGESLDGVIGPGVLLNCMYQVEDYGAKAIVQTVSAGKILEHKWDINMWGTHSMKSRTTIGTLNKGKANLSSRTTNTNLRFATDVPRGFREMPVDEHSIALIGSLPDLYITIYSETADHQPKELADAYIKELGLNVFHASNEKLDDGTPALLRVGEGTINDTPTRHAAVVFAAKSRVYI